MHLQGGRRKAAIFHISYYESTTTATSVESVGCYESGVEEEEFDFGVQEETKQRRKKEMWDD